MDDVGEQSGISVFIAFAAALRKDYAVVRAALIYPWSQGRVEGQVNRLKLIKREMHGQVNFDLLRKKVMEASAFY